MDECIDHLLFLQQSAEDEYGSKVKRVVCRYNQQYDDEMSVLAKLATRHACDLVEDQYKISRLASYRLSPDELSPTYVSLTSDESGGTFAVSVMENKCSCSFHQTLLLPCRHIMYLRRLKEEFRSVIPYDLIPERWLIADEDEDVDAANAVQIFTMRGVEVSETRVLGHNEKCRAGFAICQKIAEVIADKGSRSFRMWLSYLTKVETIAKLDDVVPNAPVVMDEIVGRDVTNSSVAGSAITSSPGVGDDDTNCQTLENEVGEYSGATSKSAQVADGHQDEVVELSSTVGDISTNSVTNSYEIGGGEESMSPSAAMEKSPTTTRRRLDLSDVNVENEDQVQDHGLVIRLNPASKPAGRPKLKKAAKKAKARKEFEDTKALAEQLNCVGDVTLATLREYVDEKKLSLALVEPVFEAIRPMYQIAVFKRPKARVRIPGEVMQVESNVRHVLPELLVNKAIEAGRNAASRERSNNRRSPAPDDIVVTILDIGTFSLRDMDTMNEWHSLAKKIKSARELRKWVSNNPESDARSTILAELPRMNVYSAFKSRIGETIVQFEDLTKFAGEKWLSDGSIFVAARHVAREANSAGQNSGGVEEIFVVDPVFLGFEAKDDRDRLLDTKKNIFSKGAEGRVICFAGEH